MVALSSWFAVRLAPAALVLVVACGDSNNNDAVDAGVDSGTSCDPTTVLPTNYRPIAKVATGAVTVTTNGGVTAGTIDATAGGSGAAADNPYIYLDLRAGAKVAINDLDARGSTAWDVALKRSSLRVNGGDSGAGNRELVIVPAATLAEVTAAPASGYTADDFTTTACALDSIPGGEPKTAFGEWYIYNDMLHTLTPKPEVYVVQRSDGSRTAFRLVTYYGDSASPMRGAYYQVEWKQLPAR